MLSSEAFQASCVLFGLIGGYLAGTQPGDAGWRWFSYHPFFMTLGFVGLMGSACHKKKLGGYMNTKVHGILASIGVFLALGGMYVIYSNKEMNQKPHLTSYHSLMGITAVSGCIMAMIAGALFLHPDFGMDKGNKTYRFAHKWLSRGMIALGWFTCFTGLNQMTNDTTTLVMFGLPLLLLAPFTLV